MPTSPLPQQEFSGASRKRPRPPIAVEVERQQEQRAYDILQAVSAAVSRA